MAKLDEIKEFIGFLKAIFLILIVIDSSLISWLFNHSDITPKSTVVIVVIIIITIIDLILFKFILKKISELKDL